MNIADKDLIIFDLDGTLSKSKMPMDSAMAAIFMKLISGHKVAVISGGGWRQYEIQFLGSLPLGVDHLDNLVLLPTSGTQMYVWRGSWAQQYDEHFSPKERDRIMAALKEALVQGGYHEPAQIYGDLIEDRGSQVTFSGLGQHAPVEAKQTWDPDRKIREPIADILRQKIPEFDIRLGGLTSIDITKRGVNKAYGIHKLEIFLKIPIDRMVFIGDALYFGGNDYPAKTTGVDCIQVSGPEETQKLIEEWI